MMTAGIAMLMCEGKTPQEIAQANRKPVLCQMYECMFQCAPRKRATSLDIAYSIYDYIQDLKRTADLCKTLHYM